MSKITDKELNSLSLSELSDLSRRIKLAEKANRLNLNKGVASTLNAGDSVEFTIPKTNDVQTGVVAKVKRVMIAIKSADGASQWNVPLTNIVKKLASAPNTKTTSSKAAKVIEGAKKAVKPTSTSKIPVTKPASKLATKSSVSAKPTAAPASKPTAKPAVKSAAANIVANLKAKKAAEKAKAVKPSTKKAETTSEASNEE